MTRVPRPRSLTFAQRQMRRKAWIARRRLLVQVRPLALAAAVALGAVSPMVLGQTVITPLKVTGQTNTVVSTQGKQTTITTQSLRDGNAFSTYSNFAVGQGDQVKMLVPKDANWWVNIVRDAKVRVDGRLESRLANGNIGGNLLFIDSHGFAVGPQGQIDTGRLTFAAPSTTFVDGLLSSIQNGGLSGATVSNVLSGQFDRSATGSVNIQGRINAAEGLSIMAGHGGTDTHAVTVSGQVVVNGRVAGSAVNLGDLKSLMPMQDVDGVIDITTPGSIMLNGMLISDSAQFTRAGAVRLVAGQDIAVTSQARVSASGTAGSGQAGGQVALMAHRDIANEAHAQLHARGDGAGAGGHIEYSAQGFMKLDGMHFDASSQSGKSGLVFLDPTEIEITGTADNLTAGADFSASASSKVTVKTGAIINTRKVASGQDATDASVLSTDHSGNISITAPSIVVESGSTLDASVKNVGSATTYKAGDITLTAKDSSNWATFVALSNANSSIDVAGTLKGKDITLLANIESKALFGGVAASAQEKAVDLAMTYFDSPLRLSLTYVQAKGDAKVDIQGTASIQASNDLNITAKADRYAGAQQQVGGSALANLGAGFAQLEGTTQIEVKTGATLTAGNDLSLIAASKSKVLMTSKVETETNEATGAANMASIVFAGSRSDVNTAVKINSGATLSSVKDLTMEAYHSGQYNTAAEVTIYGGGTAGVVGALSLQKSDTRTELNGSATVGGVARVTAMNFISKAGVSAKSTNTSDPAPPFGMPETLELSDAEAEKTLFDGFMSMASKLASAQESATGNSSSASSPKLRMAGALAWGESDHTTFSGLGAGGSLVATGHAIVDSQTLAGAVGGIAMAETTSKTTGADASSTSLSAAFNYGKHNFTTTAKVGSNATLTGSHVAINANTDMPEFFTEGLPIEWDDPFKVYSNLYSIGNQSFLDGFTTRISAKSSAENLAASGAVSLHFVNNDTLAWVDKSAVVTATTTSPAQWQYDTKEVYFDSDIEHLVTGAEAYRLDKKLRVIEEFAKETRDVIIDGVDKNVTLDEILIEHKMSPAFVMKAQNHVQTMHLAGDVPVLDMIGNGGAPESSSGAGGTAVGGSFSMVDRTNKAVAGIADGAVITAKTMEVRAINKEWALTVAPTAGAGDGIAANAMVSYNKLNETAIASVSREARLTITDLAEVKSELDVWSFGISGAVTKGTNAGVGIGLSLNEITANTKAYIGDNDADAGGANTAEGAAGFVRSSDLNVLATTTGKVGAVGIAAAMTGGPSKPGLADKADSGSASSQSKADGGAAAPLAAVTGDLQSQGAASGGDTAGASTPPKFSVAGAGAIITNFTDIDTIALIDGAVIKGVGAGTTHVAVRATQDLTQVSVAGGGALTMASNPTTKSTTSIAGAVAIQSSDDDTTARIQNSSLTQLADEAGALVVQALKGGERTAVATGVSANLSKTTTSDMSIVGSVSITHLTDDTAASISDSTITGDTAMAAHLDPMVVAYDRSRISSGGGALSFSAGKGSSGVGAVVSVVDLEGSTSATLSGGSMTQVRDVSVAALSSQRVIGAGAVAGIQTNADSTGQLMGAFVINDLSNSLTAGINSGAMVSASRNVAVRAGGTPTNNVLDDLLGNAKQSEITDFEMTSTDNGYSDDIKASMDTGERVLGVAGTLSLTAGKAASSVGLSYVQNHIQTSYTADVNADITALGDVDVSAYSRANIVGVAAGAGATRGKFSGMGSASVNLIGQRTSATVSGGTVNAASLDLDADSSGKIFSMAGNLSFAVGSGSGTAAGGAVSYTQTGAKTYTVADTTYTVDGQTVVQKGGSMVNRSAGNTASISNARVNLGSGDVHVAATNRNDNQSVAASGAFSDGNFAFTGTATWNEIGDVTAAQIDNSLVTAGNVHVSAGESAHGTTSSIQSLAGGLAASNGFAAALAFGFNTIESQRSATVTRSNLIADESVTIEAAADGSVKTISATVAGSAKGDAGAGSSSVNWLNMDVLASYDGAGNSLRGTATDLTVRATGSASIESLAGAVSGGKSNAIGGSLAVNHMGQDGDQFRVRAILNNLDLRAPVSVSVTSALAGSIGSVAASGSGAGTAALNGSVTTNAINATVLAEATLVNQTVSSPGDFVVHADNSANIASLAGTVSGGGTAGAGVAISVNEIGGSVIARASDTTLRSLGDVDLQANTSGSIRSLAAGIAGGGTAGVAGSNTTNAITSTVLAQLNAVGMAEDAATVTVRARDTSTIESFAGSVAVGGTGGGGAAIALNFLGRTATEADSSKQVKAEVLNSNLKSDGAVLVQALSSSSIDSMAIAVGVGGSAAVTGANTTNWLEDEITATWSGGSLYGSGNSLTVQAQDGASVETLASNVSASGSAAVGAALAVNKVGSAVLANLSGMTLHAAAAVRVDADMTGMIKSVAASAAVSGGGAVNGSFTTNAMTASVKAQAVNVLQVSDGGAFTVSADNDSDIFSFAGNVSGGGSGAGGAAVAVNEIGGDVTARLASSTVRAPGQVNVEATTSGAIEAIAAGAAGGGAVALAGSNTTNALTSTVLAKMDDVNLVVDAASLTVLARDTSSIKSFAGTVAGGGTAGGGAALALNFLGRTATDADSSKVVKAEVLNSIVRSSGAALVNAYSTSTIQSIAVAVGASGTAAISGSNATNLLEDEITASWTGSNLNSSSTLTVNARQAADIDSLAGNVSASFGGAVGAAVAVNRIGTATRANMVGVTNASFNSGLGYWTLMGDDLVLSAESDNQIDTIAVGMSAGAAGVQGSVAVSVIDSETHATVGANGHVTNLYFNDSVAVTANSRDRIRALAGALGFGATGVGAAGGVLTNIISSDTSAGVAGYDTHVNAMAKGSGLTVRQSSLDSPPNLMDINQVSDSVLDGASFDTRTVKGLAVQATSVQQIGAVTAVAGGGAVGAAGAAVNVDQIGGSTRAYIDTARFVQDAAGANADQAVDVMAANHAMIASSASALAIGAVGVAGAVGTEIIDRSTRAEIIGGARVFAKGDAAVNAVATNAVAQISAGGGGGAGIGIAGSGDVVLLKSNTLARVDQSSVEADKVSVQANGINSTNLIAGAIGVGGVAGAGMSFTVNVSGSTVRALVNDSAIRADGAVNVSATNATRELAVAATLGAGEFGGVAMGAVVSVMEGLTEASITGNSSVDARTQDADHTGAASLTVAAKETVDISHNAGAAGAGKLGGVGTAVNVVIGKSRVIAGASGSSLETEGAMNVSALREAEIDMVTATAGGGGYAGISGAVGVLIFGAAPDSNATTELNTGSGSAMGGISGGTKANKAQGTGTALSASDTSNLNSKGSYDTQAAFTGATGLHSTSATITASQVKAGSVGVSSLDKTEVLNNAGSLAVGGLGMSAGVALTTLGGANNASISATNLTSTGGVTVDAGMRELHAGTKAIQSRAIAGAGGLVGLGAAVSLAKNETANSASLSGTVTAGGAVNVSALDNASMRSESYGASVGAVSVGVVIAKAEQTGSVLTQVGGSITGQGVNISAQRDASTTAYAKGGSAGVVSGSGAEADASDSSTVKVALASATSLNAGQGSLQVSASSNPYANTEALGISVASGVAIGVSLANSSVSSEVAVNSLGSLTLTGQSVNISAVLGAGDSAVRSHATAGAGGMLVGATGVAATSENKGSAKVILAGQTLLSTTGDVSVSAIDSMEANAFSTGIGAGFVGIGVATSKASSNTTVAAQANEFKGLVGGVLQITATGNESINSEAIAGSGGMVAGAGAESRIDHDQSVTADLGSGSGNTLTVGSYANVSATRQVRYNVHSTSATAAALGASGAVTHATLDGSATARVLDSTKLVADGLRVLATNDLARTDLQALNAEGGGGGVISGAGADIYTRMNGDALASVGNSANLALEGLFEVRAYNEVRGSSRGQMDVAGAIPIALVETKIETAANADAKVGNNTKVNSYGETHVNALSYIDLEANSVSKTYGLAAAAQGNAYATANVNNSVTIGTGTELISAEAIDLLVGQDKDFNRNKHFVTARVDLFNHSAIPVSINPDADATLNLNNTLTVNATAVRSGATIKLGGIEGSYVVEGKGKVSDWTRDLGEMMGLSSEYGKSDKNMSTTASLSGQFEAGFGNKQRLIVSANGTILENTGDVRYTITKEDLGASAGAYVARLYDQLARYGDVPEVRAFVEAELSFYFSSLIREGLAESYTEGGKTYYVALSDVAANFLNIKNLRAGSGNIELYGNNVSGTASLMARADSEILVENRSPLNLRVFNMTVDANGGFVKYNGTYITKNADIGALNTGTKTTSLTVDSIDTRGGGANQQLPTLTVKNTFVPLGPSTRGENDALMMTAPDGTSANLYEDEMRAPELRVNGTLYNKLGTINLSNTAGSIAVTSETAGYTPRLDGKEITVTAGKNFMLSSPSISQSVGGSPESLYAVHYSDDQQNILNNLGITACGYARPVNLNVTYTSGCLVNGAGGIYASGGIFMGARYLNINGTIQSGQADYNATLTTASVGTQITNWQTQWRKNRGSYLSRGVSSMVQVSGPLPTDSESEINKQFANGTITATQRTNAINAMATRRVQPIIYFDAETNRLKVAPTNVTGGLVELVGSVINTGGGVIRALDGYARMNIDNQTNYGIDLLGLDTGGDKGVVRITDLSKPIKNAAGTVVSYEVTTFEKDANGVFHATVTDGRAPGARVISVANNLLASPSGSVKARFNYNPLDNSTYSWSAGYETMSEKSYYYQNSSWLGFIPGGSTSWNSVNTVVKTTTAMPEDVFVSTNTPLGGGNFSMQVKKSITDDETETYYRSWRKCGFLCIKKTYYIQRRTEVGYKYLYTQRVAADHAINVELVGYDTGALNVSSVGDIRLGGNISNASGNVSLTSTNGSITQLSGGAVVEGIGLNFRAKTGIGIQAAPINLITGNGSFTAVSDSGAIAFHSNSGPLRINRVSTTGEVWLDGSGDILGLDPSIVHVTGKKVYLSAPTGGIGEFNSDGTVKSTLNIQTADSTFGGLTAKARGGIAIKQATGNLWVNQVISGGDVYLESGGDLIDNNRNETRDERTEAELLALWSSSALQGASAETSRQATMNLTRTQYRRYWALRDVRNVVTDGSGKVTSYAADTITSDYKYTMPSEDRQKLLDAGVSEAQLVKVENDRTAEVLALHAQFGTTVYQNDNDQIIIAVNKANKDAGLAEVGALSTWSDAELKNPLPKSIFSKSSTSTQTRIEEPNVVGNRVVLRPGGKIGKDDGSVSIPLLKATRELQGKTAALTDDEKLIIMSAETDDMSLNRDTWTLTVVKKDTFNVLSNRLNVTSNGFVYLGADTTDAYPTGGTANLEKVIGTGEIRIKVADSILSVADAGVSVIQGQKAILEAAQGAIGSAAKPVQITLNNDSTGTLTARAQQGIWIKEIGDMRAADIYSPNSVNLTATGAIIDARPVINYPNTGDRTVRSIEANTLTLNAMGGAIGASNNPMVIKVGSGGLNASTPVGYSIYLEAAENSAMTLGSLNSGLHAYVDVYDSSLSVLGSIVATRDMFISAAGSITGANFTAGGIANISSDESISGSKVSAGSGSAIVYAQDAIALTSLNSNSDVQTTAGSSINITSVSAGRDVSLTANAGAVSAVSMSAKRNMTVKAYGANAQIQSTTASASGGFMTLFTPGNLSLTVSSALGAIDFTAGQAMSLLNVSSTNATLKLQAGQDIQLMSAVAKGNVQINAGEGVQITTASSGSGSLSLTSDAGLIKAQNLFALNGAVLKSTAGDLNINNITVSAGSSQLDAGNSIYLGSLRSSGTVDLTAGTDLMASDLTSTAAGLYMDSRNGSLNVGNASAKTALVAQALAGNLSVGAYTADTASLEASTDVSLKSGTVAKGITVSAGRNASLGSMTSVTDKAKATALANLSAVLVKGASVELAAGTGLTASNLISTNAKVDAVSTVGSVKIGSATVKSVFNANAVAGDLSVDTFTSASADLKSGGLMNVTTGTSTGDMVLNSRGAAVLGNLTSSAGTLTADASGLMSVASVKGAVLDISGGTGLNAISLTSTTGKIDVDTTTGALKMNAATAKTVLDAQALAGDLSVGTFTAASAALFSGKDMVLNTGTTVGNFTADSKGGAYLGNLIVGSLMTVGSQGVMTVNNAQGGVLDISAGTGLIAGTLRSTTGKLDVDTATGALKITSATAKTDLTAEAVSGALNLSIFTAGTASLKSGADMTLTTGTTTGILSTNSKAAASLGNLTAGGQLTAAATGAMTVTSAKGTVLDLSAGTGLTAGTLTSTTGKIDIDTTAGLLKITSATAKTDLTAQAVSGALNLSTFTAGTASLKSGADMTLTTGTTTGILSTNSKAAASLGNLTAGGQLTADATGAMTVTSAKGMVLDLSAGTGLTAGTLTSTTGKIDVDTSAGLLKITTASAKTLLDVQAVAGDLTVGTFTAATAALVSGNNTAVSTGTTTGEMLATVGRNATLGSLTSSGDKVKVDAIGTLTVTTAKAATQVDLSGRAGLTATTLTSTNAFIDVESLAGSVSVKTASAKTYFNANSYGAMTVGTFGVTAGYARLVSGGAMAITTGTSTGNMTIDGGTNAALGTLTSSTGQIDASALDGGMTFATLRAASKIKLDASKAWSSGQAISGTALYVSNGGLDLLATSGGISLSTLSGKTQSLVKTNAGSIKISSIQGFSPANLLTVTAVGGVKTVPVTYR